MVDAAAQRCEVLSLADRTEPEGRAAHDRFVAALDIDGEARGFALAYLVRAVTPGQYRLPAVAVEDMYAPQFRGRAAMGSVVVAPVN